MYNNNNAVVVDGWESSEKGVLYNLDWLMTNTIVRSQLSGRVSSVSEGKERIFMDAEKRPLFHPLLVCCQLEIYNNIFTLMPSDW